MADGPAAGPPEGEGLRETMVSSDTVYQGHFLHVKRDRVRLPDGHEVVPTERDGPALRLDRHRTLKAMSLL